MTETLLTTAPLDNYQTELDRWAEVVCELGLQDFYGVFARRLGNRAGMGIFIGEHPRNP